VQIEEAAWLFDVTVAKPEASDTPTPKTKTSPNTLKSRAERVVMMYSCGLPDNDNSSTLGFKAD